MEHQQAKEQAKAMQRFQELRQMQVQQQQMLMLQQQQQLDHLRAEQEKVQRLLAKQRGAQWGDGRNGDSNLSTAVYFIVLFIFIND